jgi:two-component system, chemotaxis family, response regulator Rcp1
LWIDIMAESGWSPNPDEDLPSASRSQSEETSPDPQQQILVVEDNEADVFLIEQAIAAAQLSVAVHVVRNGEQAIRFFDQTDRVPNAPCPALVILDINLPRRPGDEVLKRMRTSAKCGKAHVIAVSTSDAQSDRQRMAELGADVYFRKPSEYADFMKLSDMVKRLLTPPS